MKTARLVCALLALAVILGSSARTEACEKHKASAASAASKATAPTTASKATAVTADSKAGFCTPEMAAACTPEMKAACMASIAAGGPALCNQAGATAATAAAKGAKNAKATAAVVAAGSDHCGTAKASAATAASQGASKSGACGTKGKAAAATAAARCSDHGMASMAAVNGHDDCEACVDMADCSGVLDAAGAHRQAVRLKNGIMYVYTAASPRTVSEVQAAVARRADRMAQLASAGDKARLCAECKAMRGEVASGKLNREVVNIEGGSLTLVTSNDPAVVAKIHAMAEPKAAARTKS